MIQLQDIKKTYSITKNHQVEALKGVSLHIQAGEIFGIIGYSGAGKSTLIRCINLLERPTSGSVTVNGQELTSLLPRELRKTREKIGMIFQNFNLMNSRTVFQNVAYPLKRKGLSKKEIATKVFNLLEIVGISEKAQVYPSQLSGGQKQRVAIARALANNPEVILCDEATSALDPQTTQSILKLLKDINQKFKITIVIITHEMQVVKEICNQVAVMENGKIVETGNLLQIFSNPKAQVTKDFIATVFQWEHANELLKTREIVESMKEDEIIAKIVFMGKNTAQAFISNIARMFTVDVSILFGNIEMIQGVAVGHLTTKFSGRRQDIFKALLYLKQQQISAEVINDAGTIQNTNAQCDELVSGYVQSAV